MSRRLRSGYKLAQEQAMARASDRRCECGHTIGEHREYPREDARYRPLLFRCDRCKCEMKEEVR